VADFAREAILIAATATVCGDTRFSSRRCRADLPILTARAIAACRDRAAFAAADHRTLTAVATAGPVDAGIGWVTADVIRGIVSSLPPLLRVLFLLPGLHVWAADRPTARWTADRVVQIRLSRLEKDFDEAIFAAAVAAQRLARAFEAAGDLRRTLLAAPALLPFFLLATSVAVLAFGRDLVNRRSPEDLPERRRQERGQLAAAGSGGSQAPRQSIEALRMHHSLLEIVAAIGSRFASGSKGRRRESDSMGSGHVADNA
jgi:hypothetical protein